MDSVSLGIPDEFLCPITRELMKEPVIAAGMSMSYFKFIKANCSGVKMNTGELLINI